MEPIEQNLVTRLRNGEQDAVGDLASTYGSRVYQLALRYLKNAEDAEEVTQDVLLKVFQRIDAFEATRHCHRGSTASRSTAPCPSFAAAARPVRPRSKRLRETVAVSDRVRPEIADSAPFADEEVLHSELRIELAKASERAPVALSCARHPARHRGAVYRGSECRAARKGSDPEVAPTPRSPHSSRSAG